MHTDARLPRRRPRAALGAAALAALLAAAPAWAESPRKGGALTVAVETDVRGFDTVAGGVFGPTGEIVARAIEEPLLRYDYEAGEFRPLLATAWEASEDGRTWTFTLREGVKYHDGSSFDASDVAHHYNRILDPAMQSRSRFFLTSIERVEAVDALTVRFHLKHPWAALLPYLATTSMSGPIPAQEAVEAGTQNRHPVGTGPFRFVRWDSGDRIVVERFEDYWDKDAIHLDGITFRILPDTQTRYASLKSGEVDLIWTDRGATILDAAKDPALNTHHALGAGGETLLLNARNPHLSDPRVRAAIAHAWNQDALVKISWRDTRPVVRHPLVGLKDCGDADYRAYDPGKAKALLAEYGKPVSLSMIHTATPRGRELGELMQQMLKQVGMTLELQPVDQSTLVARVFKRDYDISGWRLADGLDMGPQLFAGVHSKSPYNLTGFNDPELDALALKMRTAPTREARLDLQCEISAKINADGQMLFRGGGSYYAFSRKPVRGIPAPRRGVVDVTRAWLAE
ncbi:ABC transporter substrate-binding protein [Rhodovulum sp. DZ06]|uniref:ABC transporter substrate-binding protein n=1 Tax=Rhodovulum sp. DZ06 TaxID=3425126 RepID=UPI003D35830A